MFAFNINHNNRFSAVSDKGTDGIKIELAGRIVRLLDRKRLSVREAGKLSATAAADVSRIRQGKLDRFTVDRLIAILTRLDQSLEVKLHIRDRSLRPRKKVEGSE